MKKISFYSLPIFLLCVSSLANAELFIDKNLKSGEQVYNQVCFSCHDTGVADAPKLKDKEAWARLIAEGQPVLTGHGWVGVRGMPAKGGSPDLTLVEFSRAVAYMTNHAGSNWKDPDASMMREIMKEAEMQLDKSIHEARSMKKELQDLIKMKKPKS